jgi:DNA-3-methyladenine glycosylase I
MARDSLERIYAVVARIPRGRVATYGQVARLAGLPRRARLVGAALAALPEGRGLPWQRVLNAGGAVSAGPHPDFVPRQRALLERERVAFDARGRVDLERFQWTEGAGPTPAAPERPRCWWAGTDPLYVRYHDEEWGRPVHDERRLLEMLVLEGAQAGLSWLTILRKRENYRRAFRGFDPARVARFDARRKAALMKDPGLVRNRLKIDAAVDNARAALRLRAEAGGLDRFVWSFVAGRAPARRPRGRAEVPDRTPESEALSRALLVRGFRFVGPTICYAFMQACGLVDDHVAGCFRARGRRRP